MRAHLSHSVTSLANAGKHTAGTNLKREGAKVAGLYSVYDVLLRRRATITIAELRAMGRDWAYIRTAGFTAAEVKAASACDWATIKALGFTAAEAIATGCNLASARAAGYDDARSLVAAFDLKDVVASGVDISSIALVRHLRMCEESFRF